MVTRTLALTEDTNLLNAKDMFFSEEVFQFS